MFQYQMRWMQPVVVEETWLVVDVHTGGVVGTYKSRKRALARADKLGSSRYTVRSNR